MARSSLFGRRIHISGSIDRDQSTASGSDAEQARELVRGLVSEAIERGATFVVSIDAEKRREGDDIPICFDWLVLQSIHDTIHRRPAGSPQPVVIAVQHHKSEQQIPTEFERMWGELRTSDLVRIENVSHWNMNSKRMEAQAQWGDVLVALGGSEGVLFLANLYFDAGKPVVPLNAEVSARESGARHLFSVGLSSGDAPPLFETTNHSAHTWLNRINFARPAAVCERARGVMDLLEALERPRAFGVRLLDERDKEYEDVQEFFDSVVQPVMENDLGYRMTVIDRSHRYDHPRVDQEIFERLHRSRAVVADITGNRPNCFLELGYALGRRLRTIVTVKDGTPHPFDISTFSALHWKKEGSVDDRQGAFRKHWESVKDRPPVVPKTSIVS